jgi:hypothetical protein
VRALYDFTAENPEEISFKAGDMITLNEQLDENWMHGTVNGKVWDSTGDLCLSMVRYGI